MHEGSNERRKWAQERRRVFRVQESLSWEAYRKWKINHVPKMRSGRVKSSRERDWGWRRRGVRVDCAKTGCGSESRGWTNGGLTVSMASRRNELLLFPGCALDELQPGPGTSEVWFAAFAGVSGTRRVPGARAGRKLIGVCRLCDSSFSARVH
jgi:hypothetical protein